MRKRRRNRLHKAGFDPDQPRDEDGKWTEDGGSDSSDDSSDTGNTSDAVYHTTLDDNGQPVLPTATLAQEEFIPELPPGEIPEEVPEETPEPLPEETQKVRPPLDQYPTNPTQPPGPGYKWKGPDAPGGPQGGWFNDQTKESLRPDNNHQPPVKPHWDYERRVPSPDYPSRKGYRWYPDGTMEEKA